VLAKLKGKSGRRLAPLYGSYSHKVVSFIKDILFRPVPHSIGFLFDLFLNLMLNPHAAMNSIAVMQNRLLDGAGAMFMFLKRTANKRGKTAFTGTTIGTTWVFLRRLNAKAIFVRNRMEYVALWFGLSKIGVVPALLNFQLSGSALAHCVNISDASHVILDHEMADQWEAAKDDITTDISVWAAYGELPDYPSFDEAISEIVPNRPAKTLRKNIKAGEQGMKMFTSGTTGLPKAAKVTHVRAQNCGQTWRDAIYLCRRALSFPLIRTRSSQRARA